MDPGEELRISDRTGEVVMGSNEALSATESGESKLTVLSMTCPREVEDGVREHAERNDIPLYYFDGGGKDLGLALGKPFSVSVMAVLDPGDSKVLKLGEAAHGD